MKRPGLKAGSKRQNVRLREKIKKKVAESKRKARKDAKKNPGQAKSKKQNVPNSAPFKDQILSEAIEAEERKRAEIAAKRLAAKERRAARKAGTIKELIAGVSQAQDKFDKKQAVRDEIKMEAFETDAKKEAWYRKELKYVVNRADVILEVLDARDPNGCRCPQLESQCLSNGKKIILVLNKVDLVPKQIVKSWLEVLRKELPTVAFKASTQRQNKNIGRSHAASGSTAYGADELTAVLGGYSRRKGIKTGVTCAVVGFPNVGKSSVINSLARSKVCSVGPTAGHTKTTQEVSIDKAVKLLDSPGVLFGGSAEKQAMRGALNASALADPIDGAIALLDRCDQTTLALHYNSKPCQNTRAFLAQLAQKRGMVKKGGIPDLEASARQILQDCQRGKIKFFTKAPKLETHKMPEFLDAKIVTEMAAEFKLEDNTDWMDTTDLATPTQGATVKILDDGFTELEALEEDDDEEIEEDADEGNEMEEDNQEVADETVVDFPAAKKVRFEPKTKSKPEMNDLRKRQKADKDKLKRKDKFETKLSDHFEKAFEGL